MTKTVTIQAQQKWEYLIESSKTENSLLVKLNDLGQHGWELVEILFYKDMKSVMTWTAFLKRPGIGQAPQPGAESASGITTKTMPTGQTAKPSNGMKGFDLEGNDFQLQTDSQPSKPEARA
jgi:hypothetical protein